VRAFEEVVTNGFNRWAFAVRAGRCFGAVYTEKVVIEGDVTCT
jgi:hypothetical protein